MELTKNKVIDYLTYAIAIIGIILTFQQLVIGNLNPTQAGTATLIFTTISQLGSMFRAIKAELEEQAEAKEESA